MSNMPKRMSSDHKGNIDKLYCQLNLSLTTGETMAMCLTGGRGPFSELCKCNI